MTLLQILPLLRYNTVTNLLVMGDLNLPQINWDDTDVSNNSNLTQLLDLFLLYNLIQINKYPSRENSKNILDVILIDSDNVIENSCQQPKLYSSDQVSCIPLFQCQCPSSQKQQ